MKTVIKKRNRRSIKAENLAKVIKTEIIDGRYRSGDLLPTREQLVEEYNTSKLTLQKSIFQLLFFRFCCVNHICIVKYEGG